MYERIDTLRSAISTEIISWKPFLLPCKWKNICSCVHHDEEEDATQVQSRELRVVLDDVEEQDGDLLHQDRVKGQEKLRGEDEWSNTKKIC